ncbi:MAG TPA: DMT family transporter [Candidatus Sericytochromatia bacterium]
MRQLDEQPDNIGANNSQAADVLRAMTQDIQNLRQNLLVQLSQDIERLQREKSYLIDDIEKLKTQRQKQIIQQQELVKEIAPALANQLQKIITSRLNQLDDTPISNQRKRQTSTTTANDYSDNANRLIASLDSTLRSTFKNLQQDISSYQSSLSQQLSQMHSLEQQGEAILEALVSRLKEELEAESAASKQTPPTPQPDPLFDYDKGYGAGNRNGYSVSYPPRPIAEVPYTPEPEPTTAIPQLPPKSKPASNQIGFFLVLLSSLLLSFQNVVITVIFNKSSIFGLFEVGGFVTPSVGNSLLILWLRMLVIVPMMAVMITFLYPAVWRDIKQFLQSKDYSLFINVLSSGFFLFLSQVLIYLALGTIAPGVAIAIFFVYPIFTMLLTWLLFGVRPSRFGNLLMFSVLIGFVLLTLAGESAKFSGVGASAATGSAISFALYVLLTQTSGRNLHPIPLSWIHFVVILVFSSISLIAPLPEAWHFNVVPNLLPGLLIASLVLGGTTLVSYLLNKIGIKMIDAARASVLGAIVPALTAILALVIIQSTMEIEQTLGMLLVTLGVAALSFERMRRHAKSTQANSRSR